MVNRASFLVILAVCIADPRRGAAQELREVWSARCDVMEGGRESAAAVHRDAMGNVYLGGPALVPSLLTSGALMKLSPEGVRLWTARGGPFEAMAGDAAGNVVIAGGSEVAKYAPDGSRLWLVRPAGSISPPFSFHAVALDGAGNSYVTGSMGLIVKHDPDGRRLWETRATGQEGFYLPRLLAVDNEGNLLVSGPVSTRDGQYSFAAKFDREGQKLWSVFHDSLGASAMAQDRAGNFFLAGSGETLADGLRIFLFKSDPRGKVIWHQRYEGPGDADDELFALAADDAGNLIVAGSSTGPSGLEALTVKYDPEGNLIWEARSGVAGEDRRARAVALDAEGNVVVAGESVGGGGIPEAPLIKYSPEGKQLWAAREPSASVRAVVVDRTGKAFVAGAGAEGTSREQFLAAAYDAEGRRLWSARYGEKGHQQDVPGLGAAAVDAEGNLHLAGVTAFNSEDFDFLVVKLDRRGNLLWYDRHDGPGGKQGQAAAVALDGEGGIYVTGSSGGADDYPEGCTLKYDPAGRRLWEACYRPAESGFSARALAVDRDRFSAPGWPAAVRHRALR